MVRLCTCAWLWPTSFFHACRWCPHLQQAPEYLVFQKTPKDRSVFRFLMFASTGTLFLVGAGIKNMATLQGKKPARV